MNQIEFLNDMKLWAGKIIASAEAVEAGATMDIEDVRGLERVMQELHLTLRTYIDTLPQCPVCWRPILNNRCCNDMSIEERINRLFQ